MTRRRDDTNRAILRGWSIDIPRGSATFFPPFLVATSKVRLVPRDLMHLGTQGRNILYLSLSLRHVEIRFFQPFRWSRLKNPLPTDMIVRNRKIA